MGDDYDPAEEETAFEKWVGEHLGEPRTLCWRARPCWAALLAILLLFTVLPTFSWAA